jgi:hypothetical protein
MEPVALAWAVLIISVTGFLYLSSWIRGVERKQEATANNVVTNEEILSELKQIKLALMGTYEKPGLITITHSNTDDIINIKKKCEKNHG